jgi:hypothetical protein
VIKDETLQIQFSAGITEDDEKCSSHTLVFIDEATFHLMDMCFG